MHTLFGVLSCLAAAYRDRHDLLLYSTAVLRITPHVDDRTQAVDISAQCPCGLDVRMCNTGSVQCQEFIKAYIYVRQMPAEEVGEAWWILVLTSAILL